ncbi:Nbs-lrr resistance protein [Theobroma cacao]|uniref:Nbs-lrr resistance protein n=1 Tax=Theobroma cacao TaxID=3641 RepID=A0A061F814_THECC|nr:Nbs-lrr resistance protein [Theobroma cacao]
MKYCLNDKKDVSKPIGFRFKSHHNFGHAYKNYRMESLLSVNQDKLNERRALYLWHKLLLGCNFSQSFTVAGCMRGISNPLVWQNALEELRGYIRNIKCMEDKVFACLKFSYNRLEQKDQDCFLYCALFPEDYKIKKEEIVEYWMEEGLIDELGTRQAMQYSGHSILQKLEENCMLERVRAGTHIKMHDVVRDMALHITRKRFLVKAGKQLEELPDEEEWGEDLEKISLMWNCISKIPQNMISPKCQKLATLLLSSNSLIEIQESFFENMPNLKILDLSSNGFLRYIPNSISNLENLATLLLQSCHNLENVPSLSKFQALKKLNLELTGISKIPQGLEMLINLRYLNLGFTFKLKVIPDGILSKLHRLQHFIIHPASLRAEEMKTLNKLEVIVVCFNDVHDLSMYAHQRKRLNKYHIWVSHKLIDHWSTTHIDPIILPSDIRQLQLYHCKGRGSTLNDVFRTDLKECTIESCHEWEPIFTSWCASLQTLEVLQLSGLWNLKVKFGESIPQTPVTFSSLKVIYLTSCGKLKNLLPAKWVLQNLQNLEEIEVRNCERMEEIIASEKEGMSTKNNVMFTLPKLRKLKLYNLPELKSICKTNEVMACDSLQGIEIMYCPKLKRIPIHPPCLSLTIVNHLLLLISKKSVYIQRNAGNQWSGTIPMLRMSFYLCSSSGMPAKRDG